MQMLYNSDNYAVVLFDVGSAAAPPATDAAAPPATDTATAPVEAAPGATRGGYEIVDKFARKEIFLDGAMAQSFKEGVEALIRSEPSEEEIDDYIGRFTALMQQPLVLH